MLNKESRVLMLSEKARGDANPILLIEEFEVTAGHAASIGQVDENNFYYPSEVTSPVETAENYSSYVVSQLLCKWLGRNQTTVSKL